MPWYFKILFIDDNRMNIVDLSFVSSQVHDCCRVIVQYQIFAEVEVHWLVGCLSDCDYNRLDVLCLHVY